MFEFSLSVLGCKLFQVTCGVPDLPKPGKHPVASDKIKQSDGEAPGPVTEKISGPVTQLGFVAKPRWADGRERWT